MKQELNKYKKPKSSLKSKIWYLFNCIFIKTYFPWPRQLKKAILKLFGAKISKNLIIKPNVNIKSPWLLEIGKNCWLGENVWIDNLSKVIIKDNVCISQSAYIFTGNHNYKKSTFDLITKPITIEQGVWIAANSKVCPGITMKQHSILKINSTLTKNTKPYTIYQGNPAKPIKKRIIK